jgi:uncharacterized protein (TIGR00369 family)
MSAERRLPAEYPPPRHALRDLGLWFEAGAEPPRAGFEVAPQLFGPTRACELGALAVLADVVGGGPALRAAQAESMASWIATSDLTVHWLRPVSAGELVATPRVHRAGKTAIVLEADIACAGELVASARIGYARLEARGEFQARQRAPQPGRMRWGEPGGGFTAPWREALGVVVRDAARGELELPLTPYVGNSLGALQGGIAAALSAFAAQSAGAAALARPVPALDLSVHFLALARVGPARTRARIERVSRDAALVRIELLDGERLCAVASANVGLLGN